jgi:hypothetical protein
MLGRPKSKRLAGLKYTLFDHHGSVVIIVRMNGRVRSHIQIYGRIYVGLEYHSGQTFSVSEITDKCRKKRAVARCYRMAID